MSLDSCFPKPIITTAIRKQAIIVPKKIWQAEKFHLRQYYSEKYGTQDTITGKNMASTLIYLD